MVIVQPQPGLKFQGDAVPSETDLQNFKIQWILSEELFACWKIL